MAAAGEGRPLELECSVCCELLIDPRTLSCAHTFCFNCLVRLYKNFSKGNMVDCPLCRQVTLVEDGDVSSLPPNMAVGSAVNVFQKEVDSIKVRAEAKVATLIEHVCLVNDAEEAVVASHERAISAVEHAFDETVLKLAERREELVAACRHHRQEHIRRLNAIREPAVEMVSRISMASDGISDNVKQLVEEEVMATHESACIELENILDVDDSDGSEAIAIAEDAGEFKFTRHRGQREMSIGTIRDPKTVPTGKMQLMCEYVMSNNKVGGMAVIPDNRIVIGYRDGGIELFTDNGPCGQLLQDVNVWALTVLSDGRYVVRDRNNCISLYTLELERQNIEFDTIPWLEGGLGDLDKDMGDNIYVSYWLAERIQVFHPQGGAPIREIFCDGFVPGQMCVMKHNLSMVVSNGPTVRIIDETGQVQHEVTKEGVVGCPAVMDGDGDVLIAWINDRDNLVSFELYPPTLHDSLPLLAGYGTEDGWLGRCRLVVNNKWQVTFFRNRKLYTFCFPSGAPCCIL